MGWLGGQPTGEWNVPLDETERQGYALAVRMVERVDHRQLDLTQPLGAFDYLLIMYAQLIVAGEGDVAQSG